MPGLCERCGGVHSGGRYAQMCAFSRPLACEYQVLSGSPARMLKKKTGFDRFFLYRLSPEPRPSAPECERLNVGNNARVCVRRAFFVRSGGGVCVLLCVSTSSFVNILRRSRLHHGFIMALQLIAKRIAFVSYVSIYQHTRD